MSPLGPTNTRLESVQRLLIAEGLARDSDVEKEVVEERRVASWLPAVFPSSSKFSGLMLGFEHSPVLLKIDP